VREFGSDEEDFLDSHVFQSSCAFYILQIGETAKRLSAEFIIDNPCADWSYVAKLRDVIAHQYGVVDLHILWETSIKDIPQLKIICERALYDFIFR
jgi:uncharacterized protein with HEPN domain